MVYDILELKVIQVLNPQAINNVIIKNKLFVLQNRHSRNDNLAGCLISINISNFRQILNIFQIIMFSVVSIILHIVFFKFSLSRNIKSFDIVSAKHVDISGSYRKHYA